MAKALLCGENGILSPGQWGEKKKGGVRDQGVTSSLFIGGCSEKRKLRGKRGGGGSRTQCIFGSFLSTRSGKECVRESSRDSKQNRYHKQVSSLLEGCNKGGGGSGLKKGRVPYQAAASNLTGRYGLWGKNVEKWKTGECSDRVIALILERVMLSGIRGKREKGRVEDHPYLILYTFKNSGGEVGSGDAIASHYPTGA